MTFITAAVLLTCYPLRTLGSLATAKLTIASLVFYPLWTTMPVVHDGWSLSFEMYFYLIFGASLLAGRYRWIALLSIIIVTMIRGLVWGIPFGVAIFVIDSLNNVSQINPSRTMLYLGDISYSIYLTQMPIVFFAEKYAARYFVSDMAEACLVIPYLGAILSFSALSHYALEGKLSEFVKIKVRKYLCTESAASNTAEVSQTTT